MGYAGKIEAKLRAQELRRKGLSYKEILHYISVSKDTISRWCRDIPLSEIQQKRLLNKKLEGSLKGSIIGAKKQQAERIKKTNELLLKGRKEVQKLTKREQFIVGVALYCAEGTKFDGKCEFTNANPKLIVFMMEWFKSFCKVPLDKLRGAIWLHEGSDEQKARQYWSELTGIPLSQFHKTYRAVNKTNSRKIRKNIHSHGVFSIRFADVNIHRKMIGWISGILEN
jgi:hypothetical protein